MTDSESPFRWRNLILGVLAIVVVSVGWVWWLRVDAVQRLREHRLWAEGVAAAWAAHPFDRSSGDAAEPGSAWDAYGEAFAMAKRLDEKVSDNYPFDWVDYDIGFEASAARLDAEKVAAVRARWAPILEWVARGARRLDTRPTVDWTAGFGAEIPAMAIAMIQDAGHLELVHDAKPALLSGQLQFGLDLLDHPALIFHHLGCAQIQNTASGTPSKWLSVRTPAEFEALRRALARMDAEFQLREPLVHVDMALFTHGALSAVEGASWSPSATFELRELVEGLDLVQTWGERMDTTKGDSYREQLRIQDEVTAEMGIRDNAVARAVIPNIVEARLRHALALTELRLLRMAVEHHAGRAIKPLPDPMGGEFGVERRADGVRLFSEFVASDDDEPIERIEPLR